MGEELIADCRLQIADSVFKTAASLGTSGNKNVARWACTMRIIGEPQWTHGLPARSYTRW